MTFDAGTITLISGQLLLLIAAVAQAVVQVITSRQVTENTRNGVTVAKDVESIKGHVNSEKTAAEGREAALRAENVLLRERIVDKATTAALLAQAVAQRGRDAPATASLVSAPVLESIETNTKETADNTKRTEEKVDQITKPISLDDLVASGRLTQAEADSLKH